ncbi:MAG TPA: hypothetical protein VH763_09220 [Gemmatimonadales bacterium]|jgi:hypothetical protein
MAASKSAGDIAIVSRATGRKLCGGLAAAALGLAAYTAYSQSLPLLHIYDGVWMFLGGALAVALVAPLAWSWSRERSLVAIGLAALAGTWLPLVVLALRQHVPIWARIRGAWVLTGADIVGTALPIGMVCLWFALRDPTVRSAGPARLLEADSPPSLRE